jgi:hypothetical protein
MSERTVLLVQLVPVPLVRVTVIPVAGLLESFWSYTSLNFPNPSTFTGGFLAKVKASAVPVVTPVTVAPLEVTPEAKLRPNDEPSTNAQPDQVVTPPTVVEVAFAVKVTVAEVALVTSTVTVAYGPVPRLLEFGTLKLKAGKSITSAEAMPGEKAIKANAQSKRGMVRCFMVPSLSSNNRKR